MTMNTERTIPIYLLSGFLGSGKTTLLKRLLDYYKELGLKPAVLMNELGETNLDGQIVGEEVPMAEMLGGCICCSIRADLGMELSGIIDEHKPDVIFIESTGAANPMETLDGVAEAAMYKTIELRAVITIVDGPELLQRSRDSKGRTYKLMTEQIRCADVLLLNKIDKLEPEQLVEAQQLLRELNAHAQMIAAVRCVINDYSWLEGSTLSGDWLGHERETSGTAIHAHECAGSACSHESHINQSAAHHSHSHVMAFTYYFSGAINSEAFERLLQELPANIYRAKGIVSFSDTPSRFLFQYAYSESDFLRIDPQGEVKDVAVFIGEHFDKDELRDKLEKLEN